MRRRRLLSLVIAVLGAWSLAFGTLPADAGEVTEVGGGAAGVQIQADASAAFARVAEPVVILPSSGSDDPIVKDAAGERITTPVTTIDFRVARVSTHGGLDGDPYAESTADVVDVNIAAVPIRAVSTHCIWDEAGSRASTSLTLVNGEVVEPPPNTELEIAGVGRAVVNHQERQTLSNGAEVVVVSGIHLEIGDGTVASRTLEVDVAFSSCDPLDLPVETTVGSPSE